MKFRIIQSEQQEEKLEPIIKLKLNYDGNDVNVVAIGEDGLEYTIVSFLSNGKLFKYSFPKGGGFVQDKYGRIRLVN